ncbi:unnamed protein product, partial [Ectocarpus sp. 13 AM-2016]
MCLLRHYGAVFFLFGATVSYGASSASFMCSLGVLLDFRVWVWAGSILHVRDLGVKVAMRVSLFFGLSERCSDQVGNHDVVDAWDMLRFSPFFLLFAVKVESGFVARRYCNFDIVASQDLFSAWCRVHCACVRVCHIHGWGDILSNRNENGDAGFFSFCGSVDCRGHDCLRVGMSEECRFCMRGASFALVFRRKTGTRVKFRLVEVSAYRG